MRIQMHQFSKLLFLSTVLFFNLTLSSKTIPIEDFFKDSEFTSVKISPAGDYFAAYLEDEKTSRVVVIERSSNKVIYAHSFGDDMFIGRYEWLNDNRIGVAAAKRFGAFASPREIGQFLAFDADGSNKEMIIGNSNKKRTTKVTRSSVGRSYFTLESMLDDDKENILVNFYEKSYPTLFEVNIYTGKKNKVSTSPAQRGGILLDKDNIARAAWGENTSNQNVFYYRSSKNSDWEQHGLYNYGEGTIRPISFSEDESSLIVECSINNPVNGLCSYDPSTRSLEEIYRHPKVETMGLIYQHDLNQPLALTVVDGKPERIWLNKKAKLSKKLRGIEKAFPGYYVSIQSVSRNDKEMVLFVRSDTDPGGFYIFNTETNELKDLGMSTRSWINSAEMAAMEPISFKARDGLEINGYLTRPRDQKENLPMVMFVHGGPHGVRDYWRYNRQVQFLANRGYAVMQLNYRGSGGYGMDFLEAGFLKWGSEMQDDLTDGAEWAIKKGIANRDRLCIYGASYGGYAALMSAAREPDLYKCAIGYVGVYDVESFLSVGNVPGYRAGAAYLKKVIPEDAETRKAFSPSKQVSKIKADLFLVHGKMDRQAHFKNYEILTKALNSIGKEYKSMVKDREEHGFVIEENVIELQYELIEFLDKNIGSS